MTPDEYREIAKALRAEMKSLPVNDSSGPACYLLDSLANVADRMAEWSEREK